MHAELASASLAIAPTPIAHFGVGSVTRLGQVLASTGCARAVIAADALDDEVLANAPRQPTAAEIRTILATP